VKGPLQTPAWNESERESAAQAGEPTEVGEAQHGNLPRGWRWDGGKRDVRDRGRPRRRQRGPTSRAGTEAARLIAKCLGAVEGSERLIVALTPAERREERRGRSQVKRAIDECASDRRRME